MNPTSRRLFRELLGRAGFALINAQKAVRVLYADEPHPDPLVRFWQDTTRIGTGFCFVAITLFLILNFHP